MDSENNESIEIDNERVNAPPNGLSILKTCLAGMLMGGIAYNGSFSVVPIISTVTALIFGKQSLVTIFATAFSQLLAGYLHTHSSRAGMAVSTRLFHGFYISKSPMKNRRQWKETRWHAWKRYFTSLNGYVLNFMWETFTVFYIIQTLLFIRYTEYLTFETEKNTIMPSLTKKYEWHLLVVHGVTRYLAGCLSGISTGLINHLWQRHLSGQTTPLAIFNTDTSKLKLRCKERKKLLSPFNLENWIKASSMISGALFIILSTIPNQTGLHLWSVRCKKLISDILVIHGGWLFFRDIAMLLFKNTEKAPQTLPNTLESPLLNEEMKTIINEQPTGHTPTV